MPSCERGTPSAPLLTCFRGRLVPESYSCDGVDLEAPALPITRCMLDPKACSFEVRLNPKESWSPAPAVRHPSSAGRRVGRWGCGGHATSVCQAWNSRKGARYGQVR